MVAYVYTTPGCHACEQAIEFLKDLNVEVKERDATLYPDICSSVPVVQIGRVTVLGFDASTLRRVIETQAAREALAADTDN